jgi:uncharacterized protein YukE
MWNVLGDGMPGAADHVAADLMPLAGRLGSCMARVEEVIAGLRAIQLLDWQSPAGQAYRNTVARQEAALRQASECLAEAKAAVARHAQESVAAALANSRH